MGMLLHGRVTVLLFAAIFMSACTTIARTPYTFDQATLANIQGFENIRFYADAPLEEFEKVRFEETLPEAIGQTGRLQMLALSGGGSAGAYGAGVLVGWTEMGTRPEFNLVTGVSAGALIAPFAFLGSSEDPKLKEVFTSGIAERLLKPYSPLRGLLGESLLDGSPLRELVASYVDEAFLTRIAAVHNSGRKLWVVTSNLDNQRSIVWDMGAIAASGRPEALALFRKVLVASSSIPAVFPAVRIPVEANGQTFQELHTDGGVTRQVFVVPDAFLTAEGVVESSNQNARDIHVIINNEYDPQFSVIKPNSVPVVSRAYSTLLKATTQTTINATYAFATRNNIGFRMSYIDRYIPYKQTDPFNTQYMQELFEYGRQKGMQGKWDERPPLGRSIIATVKQ